MALWTEIVDPAELTAFSRTVFEEVDTSVLNLLMPALYQDEVKFSWRVNSILQDEAEFSEFDAEATIGHLGAGEEKMARLLPISRKLRLSEYEQVTNPDRIAALADERAVALVRFVVNRLNRARAEALVTGKIELNENKLKQTINFGRNTAFTNAAPAKKWNLADADPVADLDNLLGLIEDETGVRPDTAVFSKRAMAAAGLKLAAAGYGPRDSARLNRDQVGEIFLENAIPRPIVYDGRSAGTRYIPDDVVILASSGGTSGSTVFGPTLEAQDARYNLEDAVLSGIVSGVYREDDPMVAWVLGKAVSLPILSNPDTTASLKVF